MPTIVISPAAAPRPANILIGHPSRNAITLNHGATYWRRVPPDDLVDEDASDAEDRLLF